jgi:hypothetical protein
MNDGSCFVVSGGIDQNVYVWKLDTSEVFIKVALLFVQADDALIIFNYEPFV